MAFEMGLVYEFIMIAAALWLFVHLTFGVGKLKDALLLGLIAAIILPILAFGNAILFVGFLIAAGLVGMRIYQVNLFAGVMWTLVVVFIGLQMFPFK